MDTVDPLDIEPLLQAFPAWRTHVQHETSERGAYLSLQVDAPLSAEVERGLLIHTDNGEISVSFDYYHAHFDSWYEWNGERACDSALEFVRRVVGEEIAVVSWWQGEQWCGSTYVESSEPPDVPSWADRVQWDRLRVRSWNGSYNRDGVA